MLFILCVVVLLLCGLCGLMFLVFSSFVLFACVVDFGFVVLCCAVGVLCWLIHCVALLCCCCLLCCCVNVLWCVCFVDVLLYVLFGLLWCWFVVLL